MTYLRILISYITVSVGSCISDTCLGEVDYNATHTFRRFPEPALVPW